MSGSMRIRWARVLLGGFLAEVGVFAIVFPVQYLFGDQAFLASIPVASVAMPLLFALWVARGLESRFVLHGALVGVVAALIYLAIAWGQPEPLLYLVSHGLKVVGGVAGGFMAERRSRAVVAAARALSAG